MLTKQLLPDEQEIDMALLQNLTSLKEGFCDLLAALVLFVISLFSFLHALLRIVFAVVGLLL